MPYPEKAEGFNSIQAHNARVAKANQVRDAMIAQWKAGYEAFWQTPRTHGDRALSMADLQSALDEDQAVVGQILTDSAGFLVYAQGAYAEAFGDEDSMVPPRYLSSPYDTSGTIGTNLTLVSLKTDWEEQT